MSEARRDAAWAVVGMLQRDSRLCLALVTDYLRLRAEAESAAAPEPGEPIPELDADVADYERERITAALARHRWNVSAVARELGLNRTTLMYRMRRLGI